MNIDRLEYYGKSVQQPDPSLAPLYMKFELSV